MTGEAPRRAALRLTDVVKTFPGVVALRGVTLEVLEGEVHAVVGENGAGKSTLMAVAAGATVPDSGTVEICGQVMDRPSPSAAQALGLAVVYQQPAVLEDLTVLENMLFVLPPALRPSMSDAPAWCRRKLFPVGLAVDPEARVTELGVAERQLLEIAKALSLEARVLILDEPTESLTAAECEHLFERIAAIRKGGAGVVYISHRLPEVKRVADRITVLRDGEVRGTAAAANLSERDVLGLIVGRSVDHLFPQKRSAAAEQGAAVLDVRGLRGARFGPVDLAVAPGEIVGFAGVEGNGQRDFLRALAGLTPIAGGTVAVRGHAASPGNPSKAARQGFTHLPVDRHREGVFDSLSVRENASLTVLERATEGGFVRRSRELALITPQLQRLAVRAPSLDAPVSTLSGGNQQKVLFARSLLTQPAVLLADEPTRGVDVGARVELYGILRDAANDGRAVVIVSSDSLELQGLCDRVLVFSRGVVVASLEGAAITEAAITEAALTATAERAGITERARRALRFQRFAAGDYAPAVILAILALLLAIGAGIANDRFFTERNLTGMLLLASAVVFVSLGQLVVMLGGGFDLSVGPLTGLTVIVLSYLATAGSTPLVWLPVVVLVGVVVGTANGVLVTRVKLTPVIATLVSYIVIQGASQFLRSQPGGLIDPALLGGFKTAIGPLPLAFVAAVALAIGAEWVLRRTRWGLTLRAVGSDESRAHRLGAPVRATRLASYVLCSLFAVLGGLMLASQTGIGDATLGTGYSLTSITAVVLGGASIFGGRGSFIGALLGAFLLQEIITATTFLGLGTAWQYWLPGLLILVGAAVYSRARGLRTAAAA